MESLLTRKQKTFDRVHVQAPEVQPGFKEALERDAEKRGGGEKVEVATAGAAPPPLPGAKDERPKTASPAAPAPASEDSYTGRLLAAKKRAAKEQKTEEK